MADIPAFVPREVIVQPSGLISVLMQIGAGRHLLDYAGSVESALEDFPSTPIFIVDALGRKTKSN